MTDQPVMGYTVNRKINGGKASSGASSKAGHSAYITLSNMA